ncbi:MAG: 1,4-dihydroxy-6-naphthoate synthase [Bacteroidales bacterium]
MKLSLAFSPCPNDTFAFHAMVHSLVDCEGLSFEVSLMDIENLNRSAGKREFDICKLSYSAYFGYTGDYVMLRSGSALGFNNGPLLVAKKGSAVFKPDGLIDESEILKSTIAIPGVGTTAALLLKFAYPSLNLTSTVLFSEIEDRVLSGEFSCGVLIHETRFTYEKKGLALIMDLGQNWQERCSLPVPLGGIAVKREMDNNLQRKINRILKRSIEYAFENPMKSSEYVASNAREMEQDIQRKHIEMFVNSYTLEISDSGERAVEKLYEVWSEIFPVKENKMNLFIL